MNRFFRRSAALLAALSMTISVVSCVRSDVPSSGSGMSVSDGEFVTDPNEADLGEFTVSENGIKLYYSPDEVDPVIASTLEKYFLSFEHKNYDEYIETSYPYYVDSMNSYLQENMEYTLQTSFETQCSYFTQSAGGDFTITRLKLEAYPEDYTEADGSVYDGCKAYLDSLGEMFGDENYYETVKNDCDDMHYMLFFLMVKVGEEEQLLFSEYEILVVEKDGKYYTLG